MLLIELLTKKKPVSYRSAYGYSLAKHFVTLISEGKLSDILDPQVTKKGMGKLLTSLYWLRYVWSWMVSTGRQWDELKWRLKVLLTQRSTFRVAQRWWIRELDSGAWCKCNSWRDAPRGYTCWMNSCLLVIEELKEEDLFGRPVAWPSPRIFMVNGSFGKSES